MSMMIVEQPAVEPVSVADFKDHARVDFDIEDALILAKILAARKTVENFTGKALITQTVKATYDAFAAQVILPRAPLQAVLTVLYIDQGGTTQTLAAPSYRVFGIGNDEPAVIMAPSGGAFPRTERVPGAVEVTFRAGYGDAPDDVPDPIREVILRIAGHLYENREAVAIGESGTVLPYGVDTLLMDYRRWVFA